jgi:hypothetical protein
VIILGVDSIVILNALLLDYPLHLSLPIKGSPFYDSDKKAIFLRNIKRLNSSINAVGFTSNLGLLDGEVMQVFNAFLAVNPVYKLDESNSKITLLSAIPMDIKVN